MIAAGIAATGGRHGGRPHCGRCCIRRRETSARDARIDGSKTFFGRLEPVDFVAPPRPRSLPGRAASARRRRGSGSCGRPWRVPPALLLLGRDCGTRWRCGKQGVAHRGWPIGAAQAFIARAKFGRDARPVSHATAQRPRRSHLLARSRAETAPVRCPCHHHRPRLLPGRHSGGDRARPVEGRLFRRRAPWRRR